MNKQAVLNTAVCYWSDDDQCYIVESPLFDRVAGVGDSVEAAQDQFVEMIEASLAEIKKHGLYQAPGRPVKGIVNINVQVKPSTRSAIKQIQRQLSLSSQGEVVDFLVFHYSRTGVSTTRYRKTKGEPPSTSSLVSEIRNAVYAASIETAENERLRQIEERLSKLERLLQKRSGNAG